MTIKIQLYVSIQQQIIRNIHDRFLSMNKKPYLERKKQVWEHYHGIKILLSHMHYYKSVQ